MKHCLVTGGAGFIGSHLCTILLNSGYRVTCVDSLLTGKETNITTLKSNSQFTFVAADVCDYTYTGEKIDYLFHLASPASVIDYQKYPEETALVNSIGTRRMAQLASEQKATFLFASTSEVYGDPLVHPQIEEYWGNVNPNGIRACYDESKRFGEMVTMLYVRSHQLDGRIIRIFNTYGPHMKPDDGRVVSNFINQAIQGKPLTVYGDGHQTRSFCYVDDLVNGIVAMMFTPNLAGSVINLGNPEEYTMIDLAEKIIDLTQSTSTIVHEILPKDDPVKRRPDISKAKKYLRWDPIVSLDDGLMKTVAYYKSLLVTA